MNQIKVIRHKSDLNDKDYPPRMKNDIDKGSLALMQQYSKPVTNINEFCDFVATAVSMDRNTMLLYKYIATECYNPKYDALEFDAYKYQQVMIKQGITPPSISTIYSSLKFLYFIRALWPTHSLKVYWVNTTYFTVRESFQVKLFYTSTHR